MVTRSSPFGNSKCIKSLKPLISKSKKILESWGAEIPWNSVQVLSQWHEPWAAPCGSAWGCIGNAWLKRTSKKVGMKWYEYVTKRFEKDFLVTFQGGSSWNWRSFIDLIIKSCNVVDRRVVYHLWMFESVEGLCSAAKYAWEENTNLKMISLSPSTPHRGWAGILLLHRMRCSAARPLDLLEGFAFELFWIGTAT